MGTSTDLLNDQIRNDWLDFTIYLGLNQLILMPTRVNHKSSTLIDHIYTNMPDNITSTCVPNIGISDHHVIFCNRKLNASVPKAIHTTIQYRSYKTFNEINFCNDLNNICWSHLKDMDDIDSIVLHWNKLFMNVVDTHVPLKIKRVKHKYQPDWFNADILQAIQERDQFKSSNMHEEYKHARNTVIKLIRKARKHTYESKINKRQNNPASIWRLFKEFGASRKSNTIEEILSIEEGGQTYTDQTEIVHAFNNFFINVASNIKDPIPSSNFEYLKDYIDKKVPADMFFEIPNISIEAVYLSLKNLDISKSTGLDKIGPRLLRTAASCIAPMVTFMINHSLNTSTFPAVWKEAKVKPLFKKGSSADVNNYRPISILPTLSKLIEKHVHVSFVNFLNSFKLLHATQSGFRKGHSTESAMTYMVDKWLKALNDGNYIGTVLVDFRKAFDLCDISILIQKLTMYKCSETTIDWFHSYLTKRKQLVSINNILSSDQEITCGVPQGSILGPLLFLVFINDLPLLLSDKITSVDLFADDTTLYDINKNKSNLERNLNASLKILEKWCSHNGMQLNTDKTKVMLITTRQKCAMLDTSSSLSLKYKDIQLQVSSGEKLLGINLENNLKWDSHVRIVTKKMSSYLWLLSKISIYLTNEYKLLYYKAYIMPHLNYCSIIWGNTTVYNKNKIDRLQKRACKIILGTNYTDFESALEYLNLLKFEDRVTFNKSLAMFKIANHKSPEYLCDMYKMRDINNDNGNITLRSVTNKNFCIPKCKLEMFKSSLTYSGPIIWNNLPKDLKKCQNLTTFKRQYLKIARK